MNNSILAIDIGTTNIHAVVAANDYNNKINILGIGSGKSEGVQKGHIVDINQAGASIKEAVLSAISSSGTSISKAIVSISGANTRTIRSVGSINIPSGQITHNEIKQVLNMALYNAKVIPDDDAIHVLPVYFKVDDGSHILNPLSMNGSRLEVSVNVITAKKTNLTNVRNAIKQANLEVDKFVLSGYANAIATLEQDQKKLGSAVLNVGGSTTQIVVYKGTTLIYNDFLPIGSEHITNDISVMLHTPYSAANMVKNKYGSLLPIKEDDEANTITKVKLPILGNEVDSKEISIAQIQPIIHARVEEILTLVNENLLQSSILDSIDGGIIITGGLAKIPGIKELASLVFPNLPVKISNPKNIKNGYIDFNNPTYSTIVGLLLYELDSHNSFELDSNKDLISKRSATQTVKIQQNIHEQPQQNSNDTNTQKQQPQQTTYSHPMNDLKDLTSIKIEEKPRKLGSFWKKITEWL
ncbi:MAG: cell division protein FtsA [Campylobacterales bacterium]|nr:cell division protein FtsA [Campylobacterales bacterium]